MLAFGRAEIRISLGTEARRYVIAAARIIQAAKITAFDELRAAMSESKVRAPGPEDQEHNRTRLLDAIRRRLEVRQPHDPQNEARLVQEADEEARVLAKQDAEIARIVALEEEVRRTEYTLARRVHEVIGSTDPSYDAHKLTTDQRDLHSANESLRAELVNAEEGRRAAQAAAESNANIARKVAHIAASRVASTEPLITPAVAPAPLFSELVEEFMTITSVGKKGRTNSQYQQEADYFIWLVGDMPTSEITEKTMRQFLDAAKQLPCNIKKTKKYAGKSAGQVIAMGGQPVNFKTANQRLDRIGFVFGWALNKSPVPLKWRLRHDRNSCDGVVLTVEEKALLDQDEPRRPFDDEDLRMLFAGQKREQNGVYGYIGTRRFKKRAHYWLPLMGLFTGVRGNELAQLRLADIQKDDKGTYFLDINDLPDADGVLRKSTKNKASKRKTPLHVRLIALGFLDYVQQLEHDGHQFLFPELVSEAAGKEAFNSTMTNWFKRFRECCGAVDNERGKPVFHSVRHTVTTRLHLAGLSPANIADILGYEKVTEAERTYVHVPLNRLRENLERIALPEWLNELPTWREMTFDEALPVMRQSLRQNRECA